MLLRPLVLISALVSAGFFSSPIHALSMDALETSSYIGQPLVAKFVIRGVDGLPPDASCLTIKEADNGVPGPGRMQIRAESTSVGWLIHLRSYAVVNEPAIQFQAIYDCNDQQYSREYTVLLDLADQLSSSPITLPADNSAPTSVLPRKPSSTVTPHKRVRAHKARHPSSAAVLSKKKRLQHKPLPVAESQSSVPAPRTAPPVAAHDVVKLSSSAPKSPLSQRESELMAQTEDQASRLAQMEQRIIELQKIVDKMQPYVAEASAAQTTSPSASAGVASAPAPTLTNTPTASRAPATAASAVQPKPVSTDQTTDTPALTAEENPLGLERNTILWTVAGGLTVMLLGLYLLNRREMQRQSLPWLDTEMLEDYDPELRAELRARMNAEDVELPFSDRLDRFPVPPVAEPKEPKVDFVEVENAEDIGEEAQLLITNGEGDQALVLLREELRIDPDQIDLWLLAFEYLYAERKKLDFITWSQRFRKQAIGTEAWARVCELGLELDPDNRLFLTDGAEKAE